MSEPNATTRKEQHETTSPEETGRPTPASDPNDGTGVSEQPKGPGSLETKLD
jgi:hypothetical protein